MGPIKDNDEGTTTLKSVFPVKPLFQLIFKCYEMCFGLKVLGRRGLCYPHVTTHTNIVCTVVKYERFNEHESYMECATHRTLYHMCLGSLTLGSGY